MALHIRIERHLLELLDHNSAIICAADSVVNEHAAQRPFKSGVCAKSEGKVSSFKYVSITRILVVTDTPRVSCRGSIATVDVRTEDFEISIDGIEDGGINTEEGVARVEVSHHWVVHCFVVSHAVS